jgi:hypothetical protein
MAAIKSTSYLDGVDLVARIKSWIAQTDAINVNATYTPTKQIAFALRPLTTVLSADNSIVSNAQLVGNLSDDIIQKSQKLKELIDTRNLVKCLDYFKTAPMDGCTSILDWARSQSGYNPLSPNTEENINKFMSYAQIILDAPVFVRKILDRKPISWNSGSWNDLVERVIKLFPGINQQDVNKIKNGIQALARAAGSNPGILQSGTLFVQNIIQADAPAGKESDYIVYMYYAHANLKEIRRKKKSTIRTTRLEIARAQLNFLINVWPEYAEEIWNRNVCVVVDWLEKNSTKPGDQAVQLCFDT